MPAEPVPEFSIPCPGAVERLGELHDAMAFAADASGPGCRRGERLDHQVELALTGTPGAEAGIATFSTATGAGFTWHPLSEFAAAPDALRSLRLALDCSPTTLVLAADPSVARHGYLLRVDLASGAARPASTRLRMDFRPTELQLPDGCPSAGPLALVRRDDAEWDAPPALAAGLSLHGNTSLLLGPGDYELVDVVDPAIRQGITVPANGPITIEPRLARPAVARR